MLVDANVRFLDALQQHAESELVRHAAQRHEWCYHNILDREAMRELATLPPIVLDKAVALSFVGNLVVEKGHAEYDRLTSNAFGANPVFREWKNTWVAEEEPHGSSLMEWAKLRGVFSAPWVHGLVQGFLRNGLTLPHEDAPSLLAYAALQEAATRLTHKRVKDRLPQVESHGRRLLANIVADEERHERFYANMVRHALWSGDREIASRQMAALAHVVLGFEMPGIEHDIPDSRSIVRAYRASGVFTIEGLVGEVLLPPVTGAGCYGWNVTDVPGLDDRAGRLRDRMIEYVEAARAATGGAHRHLVLLGRARRSIAQIDGYKWA